MCITLAKLILSNLVTLVCNFLVFFYGFLNIASVSVPTVIILISFAYKHYLLDIIPRLDRDGYGFAVIALLGSLQRVVA